MSLSGSVSADFNITDKRTIGFAANVPYNPRLSPTIAYADGVGAGQANKLFGAVRTLSGGTDSVDLAGLLTDAFGAVITLARVKALLIVNPAGNGDLTVGGGSNPETSILPTGTIKIKPNGFLLVATDDATAYPITGGTADLLQVTGTTGQTYSLEFLGCDA